ncbi:6-O-methylguanine DNA methyltransferase [Candidatus Termititenax persephonae]|uniref:methylated-DNA--[protein]-cysteine S-methyltransferase n=1 Tax=Candidatus Termititenax persephonae TaxID=2218525 RepID=A0A388TG18_9BACT|nr:6-O-methylguanine DNA methyltransferase [Candidatus Termititenax persephonae]
MLRFTQNGKTYEASGTDFQVRVWQELRKIPKGQVITYAGLARRAGRPHSARAAANACGANPLPVIIPCHRVIRSDGGLGGYSGVGGVVRKRTLLRKEGAKVNSYK